MQRLNLGQLIRALKQCPPDDLIRFDFGGCVPTVCFSYRGYYSDLAIGFDQEGNLSVVEFVPILEAAVGKSFPGWKGGDYYMTDDSRVWVASPGDTSDTAITGVTPTGWCTVMHTCWDP